MKDITIIFTTYNKVPKEWAKYHKEVLLEAIGDAPVISVTKESTDWGVNLLQDEYGIDNLFRQFLRAAKIATTPYVAVAEDDTLYPKEHFEYRPPLDKVAYDLNRWAILAWTKPMYFHKPGICNAGMIAPRELLIKAIEERFNGRTHLPEMLQKEIGRNEYEKRYGITEILTAPYYAAYPFIGICHTGSVEIDQQKKIKRVWPVRAYDIPKWGRAEEIIKKFQ